MEIAMPELNEAVNRSFAIARAGDVVFVEATEGMHASEQEAVRRYFDEVTAETGVKVVLLLHCLRVASIEHRGEGDE